MFRSPFDDLGQPKPEEIEGTLQCFTCYINVGTGHYDPRKRELTYTCPQGHANLIEGYDLD